jgi:quinoprotein glucose dehydrogenase
VSGGATIYNDSRFPSFIQGLVLFPEPARRTIRALKPERRDSTFKITEGFNLVESHDRLFEPAHVLIGPDGAIYFSDRPAVAGNDGKPQSQKRDGRLYRLSWIGGPLYPALALRSFTSWARFVSLGGTDLAMSLGSVDFTDRRIAQQELIRRGTLNKTGLIEAVGNPKLTVDARMLAAGVLSSIWDNDVKNVLLKLATDDEPVLRRMAAECLGRNSPKQDPQVQEALLYILGDPDSDSRRSVALAMAKVAAPDGADSLATALSFDIGSDLYLRDGLVRALERLGKPGLEPLLAMANSGEEDRLDLAVESWCALRSPIALELLPQLLNNPHLQTEQRVRLIRSLARFPIGDSGAFLPIIRYFAERPLRETEGWTALIEVARVRYLRRPGGFVRLLSYLVSASI